MARDKEGAIGSWWCHSDVTILKILIGNPIGKNVSRKYTPGFFFFFFFFFCGGGGGVCQKSSDYVWQVKHIIISWINQHIWTVPHWTVFFPFWVNFVRKNKYTNWNMLNSMAMFAFFVLEWKHSFWPNFVQKFKINLTVKFDIRVCEIRWRCSCFLFFF